MRWCAAHPPSTAGTADAAVRSDAYLSGSAEAGGEENRRWCDLLHRGRGVVEARRSDVPSAVC